MPVAEEPTPVAITCATLETIIHYAENPPPASLIRLFKMVTKLLCREG